MHNVEIDTYESKCCNLLKGERVAGGEAGRGCQGGVAGEGGETQELCACCFSRARFRVRLFSWGRIRLWC